MAADRKDLAAYHFLGLLWRMQRGNEAYKAAMEYLNYAASKGYLGSQLYLAKYHSACRDAERGAYWYTKAAEQGHIQSQEMMGYLYRMGKGVEKDEEQSIFWYQKAADGGDPSAQNTIALYHQYGKGVKQDSNKAIYWFQKAADQGHSEALITLAEKYENGDGVEQNFGLAMEYYLKASQLGG